MAGVVIRLFRYGLSLVEPIPLWDRKLACRDGLLVEITGKHRIGWGEISPLPGFSKESLAEAESETVALVRDHICFISEQLDISDTGQRYAHWQSHFGVSGRERMSPSVAAGFSSAIEHWHGHLTQSRNSAQWQSLQVGSVDPRLKSKMTGRIKLKPTGTPESWPAQIGHALANMAGPLVVDLNRRADPETMESVCEHLGELLPRIHSFEEPMTDSSQLAECSARLGFPYSLDESLQPGLGDSQLRGDREIPCLSPCLKGIVLKPTLMGSMGLMEHWSAMANKHNLEVTFSSAYETGPGLALLAGLASRYPGSIWAADTVRHLPAYTVLNPGIPSAAQGPDAVLDASELEIIEAFSC